MTFKMIQENQRKISVLQHFAALDAARVAHHIGVVAITRRVIGDSKIAACNAET